MNRPHPVAEAINRLLGAPKWGTPKRDAIERRHVELARAPLYTKGDWKSWLYVLLALAINGTCVYQTLNPDPRYVRPTVPAHRPLYENTPEYLTPPEQEPDGDWDGCTGGVHPTC